MKVLETREVAESLKKMRAADYIKSLNKEEVRAPNLTFGERFVHKILNKIFRRRDIVIEGELYLRRWYITPRSWPKRVFLHCILRPDEERHLHTHPWNFRTVVLKNGYDEVYYGHPRVRGPGDDAKPCDVVPCAEWCFRPRIKRRLTAGQSVFNAADHAHAVKPLGERAAWTLVIAEQAFTEWGFFGDEGWVDWRTYLGLPPDTPDHPEDTIIDT
jgi:hypothetical protein